MKQTSIDVFAGGTGAPTQSLRLGREASFAVAVQVPLYRVAFLRLPSAESGRDFRLLDPCGSKTKKGTSYEVPTLPENRSISRLYIDHPSTLLSSSSNRWWLSRGSVLFVLP